MRDTGVAVAINEAIGEEPILKLIRLLVAVMAVSMIFGASAANADAAKPSIAKQAKKKCKKKRGKAKKKCINKTKKKPWRQKGTGRARAGKASSPLWRGGGKIFPNSPDENFTHKVNRKAYRAGISAILSQLAREGRRVGGQWRRVLWARQRRSTGGVGERLAHRVHAHHRGTAHQDLDVPG